MKSSIHTLLPQRFYGFFFQARVDQIHVSGLDRTRDDYVRRVAQGLFKAHTFQDVLVECNK